MSNAYRDENSVPTLIGALSSDGVTVQRVLANPSTHHLQVDDSATGTDYGVSNAVRDENDIPVIIAVSSVDGFTPVEVYVDSDGNLLVDSS